MVSPAGMKRGLVYPSDVDRAGVLHGGDAGQVGDHGRCRRWQFGVLAGEGLTAGDGQQVSAQLADLVQQPGLSGGGQAQDGDDCRDADRDAKGRQARAQLAGS